MMVVIIFQLEECMLKTDMVTKLLISKLVKSAYEAAIAVISRKVWRAPLDHIKNTRDNTHTHTTYC